MLSRNKHSSLLAGAPAAKKYRFNNIFHLQVVVEIGGTGTQESAEESGVSREHRGLLSML